MQPNYARIIKDIMKSAAYMAPELLEERLMEELVARIPVERPPMNHLEVAKIAALNANIITRPTDPAEELQYALMHAAVAQAEALTRLAEVLETMLDAQTPDTRKRIAELENELEQLQQEYAWLDRDNDRLRTKAEVAA